jgi:hypothetical protein
MLCVMVVKTRELSTVIENHLYGVTAYECQLTLALWQNYSPVALAKSIGFAFQPNT